MKRINQLEYSDIVFFETDKNKYQTCQLKHYIHFLSFMKVKRPFKFSHIQAIDTLIPNLTIKENIQLDNCAHRLLHDKEFDLNNKIDSTKKPHLKDLIEFIGNTSYYPDQLSTEKRKVASLIKGLLQTSDYLFLECPEYNLSKINLENFILAMDKQSLNTGQITIINSPYREVWSEITTKIVTRNKDKSFSVQNLMVEKSDIADLQKYRYQKSQLQKKKDYKNIA